MILSEKDEIFLYKLLHREWIPYEVAELNRIIIEIGKKLERKYPGQSIDELARRVRAEYDVERAKEKEDEFQSRKSISRPKSSKEIRRSSDGKATRVIRKLGNSNSNTGVNTSRNRVANRGSNRQR